MMNTPDDWRPACPIARLEARAKLLQDIRAFFLERDILEVETPVLSLAGNTDPQINSIRTQGGGYLRTSPEFALKRLLAAGSGDIFELGRVFRAGESGRSHNPEFTMLEWYRLDFSYHQLMDEVAELVRFCGHGKFDDWPVDMVSYRQLFVKYLNIDPFIADEQVLSNTAKKHGIDEIQLTPEQWQDLLISFVIQPSLPTDRLTFVYDFPASQAALARIRCGDPPVAERFELYLGQTELANGYQELTDSKELQRRFESENDTRRERGLEVCKIDHRLIAAQEHGLPECAGVALGVDRLLMSLCDQETISKVTAFPFSRA